MDVVYLRNMKVICAQYKGYRATEAILLQNEKMGTPERAKRRVY